MVASFGRSPGILNQRVWQHIDQEHLFTLKPRDRLQASDACELIELMQALTGERGFNELLTSECRAIFANGSGFIFLCWV